MNYIFAFEKLEVWKLAKKLVLEIYSTTRKFPNEEKYGIVSQLNRASISIVSNIAEGSARKSDKDKAYFYQIAYSSLVEVYSILHIAKDLMYIEVIRFDQLRELLLELSNKINALHRSQLNNSTIKQFNKVSQ
jgi:four helix bundle protein